MVDAHGHAKAVEFYFIQPLRSRRSFSTGWESRGGMKRGRGESLRLVPLRDRPDLTACEAERLTTSDTART